MPGALDATIFNPGSKNKASCFKEKFRAMTYTVQGEYTHAGTSRYVQGCLQWLDSIHPANFAIETLSRRFLTSKILVLSVIIASVFQVSGCRSLSLALFCLLVHTSRFSVMQLLQIVVWSMICYSISMGARHWDFFPIIIHKLFITRLVCTGAFLTEIIFSSDF